MIHAGNFTQDSIIIQGKICIQLTFAEPWEDIPEDAFELTEMEKQVYKMELVKAIKEHHKKIMAYLKRYGMEKVNTWSYWQDA